MNGVLVARSGYLPEELMSEIFLNCSEPDEIGCVIPSSTAAPLTLSWVCRRWRRISFSTPKLWAGINVQDLSPDGVFVKDRKALLNLLALWISRSRSCPISIKFSFTELSDEEHGGMLLFLPEYDDESAYQRDMKSLIEKLLSCQHRWRALDMSILDLTVVEPLLKAVSVRPASPLLEHLSVATQYLGIFGEVRTYNLALSSSLRTIRILSPLIVPEANSVQFEQLRELDLKYCSSMKGCLQWIDKAPNLETLKVRFFAAEMEWLQNERHVRQLENLSVLQISSFSLGSDPAAFINLFDLPALTDLFIDVNDLIEFESWTCVLDLLRRSRPPALEALTLLGTPMTSEHILECLRMSPKLTYLSLGTMTNDILHALSAATPMHPHLETPLCPALEVVEIADMGDCSTESLINFSTSRGKKSEPVPVLDEAADSSTSPVVHKTEEQQYRTLATLIIPHDPDYSFINHPDIAQCVKEGLKVLHRAPPSDNLPPTRAGGVPSRGLR